MTDKVELRRPFVMFLGVRGIGAVQGGIETHVRELVRHLPLEPDQMEVVGRLPYKPQSDAGGADNAARVKWLPALRHPLLETLPHTLLGLAYAIFRRPALLHLHGIGPALVTRLARAAGLRVVTTHHGEDYNREKWGAFARVLLRRGERECVLQSDACIAISPSTASNLQERLGHTVHYIPNGVTSIPYAAPGPAMSRWGLQPGRYILCVARLVPEKRQLDLVRAFLKANLTDVKLVLCGGSDHGSGYAEIVSAEAEKSADVALIGAHSGTILHELLWHAGLFVLPSSHEGLPIALLEAMSCDRRVLVSDLPVYAAIGLPGDATFACGDVDVLSERLSSAFREGEPAVRDWQALLKAFKWNEIAQRTMEVYERAVAREPK